MQNFTHMDENGNAVMVDVSQKDVTERVAVAEGYIVMSKDCHARVLAGKMKKGDVLSVAQVAGIMAAKKNSELIPLCHTLLLTSVRVTFDTEACPVWAARQSAPAEAENSYIRAVCTVSCTGKTGVEMEALTGVSVALLTIYDMCKAIDRSMTISGICLLEKRGGKSGVYQRRQDAAL